MQPVPLSWLQETGYCLFKEQYHRFLGNEHYNWGCFITLLAARVTMYFDTLTDRSRFKALVLDDSVIERSRSKAVKLVFVRNRNNQSEYIIFLPTDCSLSDAEIIRKYGYRWNVIPISA